MLVQSQSINSFSRQFLLGKVLPSLLSVLVMYRLGNAVVGNSGNVLLWLAYVSEAVCFVTLLASFEANVESATLKSTVLSYVPCYFFLVFQLGNGLQLIPLPIGVAIMASGLSLQLAAKLKLGRRFGILPAHRGIMTDGPYRLVRHPIYFGYFLMHCAFLLSNFSLSNLCLLATVYTLIGLRAVEEEKVLGLDPAYGAYARRVRYRLIPGLF
jgi:protein-S-isoprenylcysteine O-methyltransferase Ste14